MISIKRILIPVDFSRTSRNAVALGISVAREFQARTFVAHIVPHSGILLGGGPTDAGMEERSRYEAAKRDIPDLIPAEHWAHGSIESLIRVGDIDTELLKIVDENHIDLIIMGTHGRRPPARWFIGSVTERMLRKMPRPVMTLSHVQTAPTIFKRILYATDLSEDSAIGFRFAIEFARMMNARVKVIHVAADSKYLWADAMPEYLRSFHVNYVETARKRLNEFIERESVSGLKIESLVVEGTPFNEILRVAESNQCDLIVINLQSKTAAERAFLGSTAERIVRMATVPVLSVPLARHN